MDEQKENKSGYPARDIITVVVIIGLFLLLVYSCTNTLHPSRAKEVKILKSAIPGATEFVNDNAECMKLLLDIKERIIEVNEKWADTEGFEPVYYWIQKSSDEMDFELRGGFSKQTDALLTLTEDEQSLIEKTLTKPNLPDDGINHISIGSNGIEILYLFIDKNMLTLDNPVREIRDPGDYRDFYEFTVPVNGDWCIRISGFRGPW